MSSAIVLSIDALKDFKLAMITFAEEAKVALGSVEMELRQMRNWLERDQLTHWKTQIKKREQAVQIARSELARKKLSASDAVSDSDQKDALRIAQRRLREAEEMVERIKKWIPVFEHATSEYHSQSQPLGDRLSGSFINSLTLLERMITMLEQYLAISAPAAPVMPASGGSSSGGSPAPKSAGSKATTGEPAPTVPVAAAAPPVTAATGTTTPTAPAGEEPPRAAAAP